MEEITEPNEIVLYLSPERRQELYEALKKQELDRIANKLIDSADVGGPNNA